GDANKKLHEINQERIRTGYPVLREFVFEYDMTGVWWIRYLVQEGKGRSMLPYQNHNIDICIYDRLFKLKLILPDPFSEAHKATRFCDIWGFDEDAYIQRYHRWLSDIDLLTEGVEEANDVEEPTTEVAETATDDSSHDSDEVNMGGINLRMMERYIDNLEVAEEEGPVDNDSVWDPQFLTMSKLTPRLTPS
ncbi:hypothetical protein (Partial), partial [Seminavis robusta]